jgi:heme/copper-type cytochrome/quinol oxidase subunit 2
MKRDTPSGTPINADWLTSALGDADAITGTSDEPTTSGSQKGGLNVKAIASMCVILVAIVVLFVLCVLGHRRQNRRDREAGIARGDARVERERRLPQVGIVG